MQQSLDHARTIEAGAPPTAACDDLAKIFRHAAGQVDENDPRWQFIVWELALYDYRLSDIANDPRGLVPMFQDADSCYPAPISQFPEAGVDYFKARLGEMRHPSARARLGDFLWLRMKDYRYADIAIDDYIKAADAVFQGRFGPGHATKYLTRAAQLARLLKRNRPDIAAAIRSLAERLLEASVGHLARLIDRCTAELCANPAFARDLAQRMVQHADTAAATFERFTERVWLETARTLREVLGDRDLARELRIRSARSLESEADERAQSGALLQSALLQDALRVYADLGLRRDVERVALLVHEASTRAMTELKPHAVTFEAPTDALRREVEALLEARKHAGPWSHLIAFALTRRVLWPDWSDVAARTAEVKAAFPLQFLFPTTFLGPDGRPLQRPTGPDKEREFDEIHRYVQAVQLSLALYGIQATMFREARAWDAELLMQALSAGALFSDDAIEAIRPGILAFEEGRCWEALHVLVPQIERTIRTLALGTQTSVYSYDQSTGEIRWRPLNQVLREPRIAEVLAKIWPDVARELAYLLADSRGWNLRNDIAHGIRLPSSDDRNMALLSVLILLTLSAFLKEPLDTPPDKGDTKDGEAI
jgi:uncharacterized protein DUF4209